MFNYAKQLERDVITVLTPYFERGVMKFREKDSKIDFKLVIPHKSPWYFVKPNRERTCTFWKDFVFKTFKFIPARCQGCWKVVVKPQTLKQLFDLAEYQERHDYDCKCGIEVRPNVFGNYGGYFYFNSKEEGLKGLRDIRFSFEKLPVFLKRGCTEMEHAYPDSRTWKIHPSQREIEKWLVDNVIPTTKMPPQTPDQIRNTKCRWVEHAFNVGDETYKKYTDGNPLYPPYVTYEE